jgi:hypothetical protein
MGNATLRPWLFEFFYGGVALMVPLVVVVVLRNFRVT